MDRTEHREDSRRAFWVHADREAGTDGARGYDGPAQSSLERQRTQDCYRARHGGPHCGIQGTRGGLTRHELRSASDETADALGDSQPRHPPSANRETSTQRCARNKGTPQSQHVWRWLHSYRASVGTSAMGARRVHYCRKYPYEYEQVGFDSSRDSSGLGVDCGWFQQPPLQKGVCIHTRSQQQTCCS